MEQSVCIQIWSCTWSGLFVLLLMVGCGVHSHQHCRYLCTFVPDQNQTSNVKCHLWRLPAQWRHCVTGHVQRGSCL